MSGIDTAPFSASRCAPTQYETTFVACNATHDIALFARIHIEGPRIEPITPDVVKTVSVDGMNDRDDRFSEIEATKRSIRSSERASDEIMS
jgi:hypothetical protein